MNNIGEYLKNTRMAKNFTIEEVAEATGIRAQYLAALENCEYTKIPGDVFIKGFIRNYGNYLGVDGNDLVEQYKRRNQDPSLSEATLVVKKAPEKLPHKQKFPTRFHEEVEKQPEEVTEENTQEEISEEPKKQGFLGGAWADLKAFVIDNIYETVEDEEGDQEEYREPVKEQITVNKSTRSSSFFSVKVFGTVFVICMVVFIGVMGYFMFSGKSSTPVKIDTGFTNSAKSAHSSEQKNAAEKNAEKKDDKTAEKQKEDKKEEAKTLGTGEGVTVEITVLKPCWTQVTADGKTLEAATLQPGATRIYKGSKSVKVNVGSIRFVKIKVNGKDVPVTDKEWGEATKVFTK